MKLVIIPPQFVDAAWKDGANKLGEATKLVDEITESQLKMILARGERTLVRGDRDGQTVGWMTFRIDQLPNMRVLFICDMYAPNAKFEDFFGELSKMAQDVGCSRIRCSALEAQGRLYRQKLGFTPVYTVFEKEI